MIRQDMTAQDCFRLWLSGTTCGNLKHKHSIKWISDDGKYAIFHHKGHSSYCGRAYGNLYCKSYYALVDVCVRDTMGQYELKTWEGRWKDGYIDEAKEIILASSVK